MMCYIWRYFRARQRLANRKAMGLQRLRDMTNNWTKVHHWENKHVSFTDDKTKRTVVGWTIIIGEVNGLGERRITVVAEPPKHTNHGISNTGAFLVANRWKASGDVEGEEARTADFYIP